MSAFVVSLQRTAVTLSEAPLLGLLMGSEENAIAGLGCTSQNLVTQRSWK